jgi:hypothetical protein
MAFLIVNSNCIFGRHHADNLAHESVLQYLLIKISAMTVDTAQNSKRPG